MSRRPWLSVVMPVHEGTGWIAATLDSLAAEADDGVEVIALDSSPDERTFEIMRRYQDRLDLRLDRRPEVKSWTEKTNLAAARARGTHLCMLHQDDLWLPGRLAALRRWRDAAPDAALHLASTAVIDARGRRLGTWRCPLGPGAIDRALLIERLLVQNFVSVPAPLIRTEAWAAVRGLRPDLWYTADWDLWLKLAALGPVHYHSEPTTGFRVHGGSLTVTGSRDQAGFEAQMRAVLEQHLPAITAERGRRVSGPARASIAINRALAEAAGGSGRAFLAALASLLRLGPLGLARYLYCSRLLDRVLPRLRARLAGQF